ncbi:MAG: CRISPR system precrRNA processing endoribonuclease RAMP protein Cas6 [Candidatus Helarchaeota archaeon]
MLKFTFIQARLQYLTPARWDRWLGSAFRGGFGRNLKNFVCMNSQLECSECNHKKSCLFYYIYIKNEARVGHAPPVKPVIFIPPFFGRSLFIKEDPVLNVDMLFFGDFIKYAPHIICGINRLGSKGLGSMRYENLNRFVLSEMKDKLTNISIFNGTYLNLTGFQAQEIKEVPLYLEKKIRIGFRTPFTGKDFPPDLDTLIELIRRRLIRFVNEHGNKERVPEFHASGKIIQCESHFHKLERRSSRSDKRTFKGFTGIVEYHFRELDDVARWLLSVGLILGCGPDSSFGCGFLQDLTNGRTHELSEIFT